MLYYDLIIVIHSPIESVNLSTRNHCQIELSLTSLNHTNLDQALCDVWLSIISKLSPHNVPRYYKSTYKLCVPCFSGCLKPMQLQAEESTNENLSIT